jgi:hypothetical protein
MDAMQAVHVRTRTDVDTTDENESSETDDSFFKFQDDRQATQM